MQKSSYCEATTVPRTNTDIDVQQPSSETENDTDVNNIVQLPTGAAKNDGALLTVLMSRW